VDRQERETIIDAAGAISAATMCFGAGSKETELAIKQLYNVLGDISDEKACQRCSCQSERIYDV
jgi:hypothetical protein